MSDKHSRKVNSTLAARNYTAAVTYIEEHHDDAYGETNEVLYGMDLGMALHLQGDYAGSNNVLHSTEQVIEDLYTTSISNEAAALATNDNVIPYDGEDHERVLINVLSALNYVFLGQWDEALVEARKVDTKLRLYASKYKEGPTYREDAFVRYLMGLIYEAAARGNEQDLNDAYISYKKSFEIYEAQFLPNYATPIPPQLGSDLCRLAEALGFEDDLVRWQEKFPQARWLKQADFEKNGEVVLVHLSGLAPRKKSKDITVAQKDYILRLALPEFRRNPPRIGGHVLLSGGKRARSSLVHDTEDIAVRGLDDRMGREYARLVARAAVKAGAVVGGSKGLSKLAGGKKSNQKATESVLRLLFSAAAAGTEQADLRSWRTLPAHFHLSRLPLAPGKHEVSAEFITAGGAQVETKGFAAVDVKAGTKTFLRYRTYQ